MKILSILYIVISLTFLSACDGYPKDTDGTLEQIAKSAKLKVGILYNPPWAQYNPPDGIEIDILQDYAKTLSADAEFKEISAINVARLLDNRDINIVAGGLGPENPYAEDVALTRPYAAESKPEAKKVFAV